MSNFERVPHDKLMTAFDCDADKVKSAEGFVGYLYRNLAVPAQETSERELLACELERLANHAEINGWATHARYERKAAAMIRAAGDAPAWDRDQLRALCLDFASVNLTPDAAARQADRIAHGIIASVSRPNRCAPAPALSGSRDVSGPESAFQVGKELSQNGNAS